MKQLIIALIFMMGLSSAIGKSAQDILRTSVIKGGLVTFSDLEAQHTWQIVTLTRGPYPTWTFVFGFYSAWSSYPTWKLNGPGKFPL